MRFMVLAVLFLSTAVVQAQGKRALSAGSGHTPEAHSRTFEHENECGSPLSESMAWRALDGTAIEVTGARAFILRTTEGKEVQVDLVALEVNDNPAAARELLASLIQGRAVMVLVNPDAAGKERALGAVQVGAKDASRELLRAGVARFEEPTPYGVSNYLSCLYRIAEREARQAKRGLWK